MPRYRVISQTADELFIELDFSEDDTRYIPEAMDAIYDHFIQDFSKVFVTPFTKHNGYNHFFSIPNNEATVEVINDAHCAWLDIKIAGDDDARRMVTQFVYQWVGSFIVPPDARPYS